ncbi:extracellular matrix protein FRAS1 isoform X12 [Alligator sinensis]|uniref:Large ribosomal subunit protein uL1m n=1 Tax=Alligator sinensis TaxID=38654 RepID=A0A3Q0GSG0_ALLSI|nr:extracellular matrix protein FRAS1 isoform X12 [Alligator sinensis]
MCPQRPRPEGPVDDATERSATRGSFRLLFGSWNLPFSPCAGARSCLSAARSAARQHGGARELLLEERGVERWKALLGRSFFCVWAQCPRYVFPRIDQHVSAVSCSINIQQSSRPYAAAAKSAKNPAKDVKQKKSETATAKGRRTSRPLASKPVDDVYLVRLYKRPVYEVEVALDMLRKFQELDFTNPKQYIYVNITLDMTLEKKKKVDPFANTIHLPHHFEEEINKILVFTENAEQAEIAKENGAAFVGGTELIQEILDDEIQADFYIAVPEIIGKLNLLKSKLRNKFPSSRKNSLGPDIPQMLEFFKTGHAYMVEEDCLIRSRIGRLDIPNEQILANLDAVIKDICTHRPLSYGACVYQGSLFENNTIWKPDSCQDCSCHSNIVTCEPAVCRHPWCDFQKGEVLQIPPNKCCPECVLGTKGFCQHEGQTHGHGTEWASSQCTMCFCANGTVHCSPKLCLVPSCGSGELEYVAPGDCCPKCVGIGESCSFDGQMFRDGEEWQLSPCSKCFCRNGATQCFTAECRPVACSRDEVMIVTPGKCCPECVPKPCSVSGEAYKHGQQWKKNPCTTCICHRGEARCVRQACASLTCEKDQNKVQRPGKCCEECVSSKGICLSEGIIRYHNEMWNGTRCEFCMCDGGQVTCQNAECAKVECAWGEELIHLEGKCCPECVSSDSYCVYKEHTKDIFFSDTSEGKHIKNGEKWKEGLCKECECRDTQVICYRRSCLLCPLGSLAVEVKGDCCPQCKSVQCHPDCLVCSQSFDHCDVCRDATKQLQNGRCVENCESGFYKDAGVCLACKETCLTCTSGFECTSCQESMLMKHGQCVASCGEGFFQDYFHCAACHESCSTCWGPAENNCLACKDHSHVLKAGVCVTSCGQGFYIRNGICNACDQSCETCYSDRLSCLTCASDRVLHSEKCMSECPAGYYAGSTRRCRACHESCSTCTGPLATHCTSCPLSLALRQGQCLSSCGEGFYRDHDVCKGCHPSCHACIGPESFHCTRCREPEEALQLEQHLGGALHGVCLPQCNTHFYLDVAGVCRQISAKYTPTYCLRGKGKLAECHALCSACIGSTPQNCTACAYPQVLHDGMCLLACPEGLYSQEGHCYACHPSCRKCSGPSDFDCIACHPHTALADGKCRTSCKEEQYLNLVGYCVDCHPLCHQCVADLHNTGSICLQCQNARHLLLGDHCVPDCPMGYYAENGACKRCHPSCKTCSGRSPFSCSSCESSLVLSHTGLCTSACFPGHYRDGSQACKPCNSQCLSCESTAGCTLCRDLTKVLLFGECQYESCTQQYYLDFLTKTCRECDWSCNACKGPQRTDCLQCMDDFVLHDGACVEQCPQGFYKESDICQRCDDHCLQCHQPMECTLCEAPFFLLETQCVRECGKKYYEDHVKQKCAACPAGCLECDNVSQCQVCDTTTFLKNNLCVSECGHDFYGNSRTRKCEAIKPASVLLLKGLFTVGIGGIKPLDSSVMDVHDVDGKDGEFLFHVVSVPTNGRLVIMVDKKEVQLNKGDHFTWEDVQEKRVRFVHSKEKSRKGQFSLKVSDQQNFSQPEVITVQAISTQAPYMLRNEALFISRGDIAAITDLLLDIQDNDNPQDVVVMVLDPPHHGRLVKPPGDAASEVQVFSLHELASGLLHYAHDGSDSLDDTVVLQVNDGYYFQNVLFHVKIVPKSDRGPQLLTNSLVWVPEGGMLQITNRILRAEVPGASDSEITYAIIKDQPRYGEVVLLLPMPADGPAESWQRLPDGRAATPTMSFTQRDINEGIVWYKHSGSQVESDSFHFQVSSATAPQTHLETHMFNIAVLPHTPKTLQLSLGSSLHMTALEDRVTVIEPHHLSFVDPESPSEKIVFNVTVPVSPNQGVVEHRDRPLSPIKYFTQADINQGKIAYRPPAAAPHMREITAFSFSGLPESVNFRFIVSDGEHVTPEMAFTIHLDSVGQQPPVFQTTVPFLKVSQGGKATLGVQLEVSDVDTAPEDLFFELVEPPRHGVLLKNRTRVHDHLRAGDTFTYEDITQNALQYVHDGSSAAEDSMEISVTDGVTTATTVLRVEVSLMDSNSPRLAPGCLLTVTVDSKSSVTFSRSHLAYIDNNSPDSEITIQLISLPMYGTLLRASGLYNGELVEVYNFTMEDINNQKIRYTTAFETSDQPVTDIFHFSVFDADNNQLDSQMFTITITPVHNRPSVIAFADHITVDEGGRVPLSIHQLLATDYDTAMEELVVTIITLPIYGCIENTKTGAVFGPGGTADSGASFPIQDVLENHVYYFQSVHESVEPTHDLFRFSVSSSSILPETWSINITIQRQNDEPPKMVLEPVRVRESLGVVISNTSLSLQDLDTPDNELVFVVTQKPRHGHLRRRQSCLEPLENGRILSQGSSFTYQDVLDKLIVYTLAGAEAWSDEFRFSLTDGLYTEMGRVEFSMELPKNEPPRLAVNRGLQLPAGSVARITDQHLKAADIDSDDLKLRYVMKKDPSSGRLQLTKIDNLVQISVKGPVKSFTQVDINKGQVEYSHEKGEPGGSFAFNFDVIDAEGNKLMDQSFYISVLGTRISSFSQADLASRSIQYIHTSEVERHSDSFTFSVSDGVNEVSQTFDITINPVDDSLPVVQNPGMRVQEGVRKTITEFELKATDADTEAELVTFTIVQPPRHGVVERTHNGQHYRQTTSFTMDDIFQNRISYSHDGSNSLKDRFTFTVSDGTNPFFVVEDGGKEIVTAAPQRFKVDILPVDDGTPRIVTNLGLQWLEYMDGKATNLITKKELLTMDPDTEDKQLIYEITAGPKHGYVESKLRPGIAVTTFTQEDVNLGLVQYVLNDEKIQETMDSFQFLVKDSKPNMVSDNIFHIQWSLISFEYTSYNISEKASSVSITVKRIGNLNQYAIVLCRTEQGTATSSSSIRSEPGQQDYVEYAGQVQFDEREDTKACTVLINDDDVFENIESFTVELSMPAYALLGEITQAKVVIKDTEDEPTLQFDRKTYYVNESAGFLSAPIERKGDASSIVSAVCYTTPKSAKGSSLYALESGSDFKSRGMSHENRVIFGPGVTMSTCDIKLIDDSEYEEEEEFEIALADASDNARIGSLASARVLISGPNDASTVFLGNASFTVSEDAGTIEIPVIRHGTDLSTPTSVWCATRLSDPPSASPGIDYIPSSKKVEFRPGRTEEYCTLTILDDAQYPVIEGLETFVVYLSSPQGAELTKPFQAIVAINDIFQDVPNMQFGKDLYTVKEKEGVLHIPVIRSGDLSYESSVRCYTRSQTAEVMEDFEERRDAEDSRITFLKGEKVKNCTVYINDDSAFEPEEQFRVYLGSPMGNHWSGARMGKNTMATITVSNDEDAPTIEFEETAYQVREPPGPEGIAILNIKVVRRGDLNRTSKVRCSTRDGSAQSGVDYYPKSRVLKFSPGVDHILFKVEIMSNEDREWHESFSLVLGPDDPVEAVLGDTATAIVTILDQEAAGSLILPAPPIVVTLADYDHVEEVTKEGVKKSPSPGYPLICVTPCDPHFPKYTVMKERCDEAGINQSSIQFSWEVATPTDGNGARSPFETITDNTPFTSINHMVLDSIYFSRRFHVRCVAKAVDKAGHVGTPLRSNIVTIGTDSAICHTPVVAGTARGFQAQSFIATLKYLDVKHKEHPNRIHISVQIPHQDGMLPLISTMPLHNLHFLLSESIYRHQHVCSNLVTISDLKGISEAGFLDEVTYDSLILGPGYDRPYQFDPTVREPKTIQLYKQLNLKSCIWTFDAYYDMTELIDVCGGSVTADFQVRDSAQSFLTVHVPLYVSYIYVTAPRGWASLEHHTEMEFSFFYDTVLWRTGIQTDSVLSARLQIIRIYIREDGRLVIEFKTQAKFRGLFVMEHHTLPDMKSFIMTPDHLGGIEFDLQLLWSAQTFDSPYQLWRATSSYNRKDYSGEYTIYLIPCTVQPTQPWVDPGDKPLACTAHAPERFLIPIAFQQTNRPVPVVYSLNTEFQLCNNERVFLMDPTKSEISLTEMDYKGAFSKGQILYGRVLWNPEQNLNAAYKLQLEKVYLCTGKDGYVPFFDPTGTIYNEGPQYGCIQPNKHLKHRFLLLDRNQPEVTDRYFHDVPFDAHFASELSDFHSVSSMPGVDGFTMKVDALYKVEAGHQWYLQVIYVIGPETIAGPRVQRSLTHRLKRGRRDLVDNNGRLILDDSLIYDNEGDQIKNGTNMKSLSLEVQEAVAAASFSQTGASIGTALAAIMLLLLVLLIICFITRKCQKQQKKKKPTKDVTEEYPLNTKIQVPKKNPERVEKNVNRQYCTVRNINILSENEGAYKIKGAKVKQVNLEVKVHNNLHDGTEV